MQLRISPVLGLLIILCPTLLSIVYGASLAFPELNFIRNAVRITGVIHVESEQYPDSGSLGLFVPFIIDGQQLRLDIGAPDGLQEGQLFSFYLDPHTGRLARNGLSEYAMTGLLMIFFGFTVFNVFLVKKFIPSYRREHGLGSESPWVGPGALIYMGIFMYSVHVLYWALVFLEEGTLIYGVLIFGTLAVVCLYKLCQVFYKQPELLKTLPAMILSSMSLQILFIPLWLSVAAITVSEIWFIWSGLNRK